MKSENIIYRVIIKSIIFVVGLAIGIFSAIAFDKFLFPPVNQNEVRPLLENVKDYSPTKSPNCKRNPLVLVIQADRYKNLTVNNERKGNLDDFSELKSFLKHIFAERKINKAFELNSTRVVREVIIIPSNNIRDSDLFNLVDALKEVEVSSILIDWNSDEYSKSFGYCPYGGRIVYCTR